MQNSLDALLSEAIRNQVAAGLVAAVADAKGMLYHEAFGKRCVDQPANMTADSVMAIMSMTKAVTSAAALQLVEQGRLSLDAPAGAVCTQLGATQVLAGFNDKGEPILRAPKRPITLRSLLTHTSGFVYNTWNADMVRYMAHNDTPDISSLKKAALDVPLLFDPGNRWEYGIGTDWVGQMIEAVSGQTLGAYFADHLTGPLEMHDTAFTPTAAMAARMATIHMRKADGSLKPLGSSAPAAPEFEMGGGGLLSTAADYIRFIRMILNQGELDGVRVLQPDTVAQMCRNQLGELRVSKLATALPVLSNDAEFFPGEPKTWGLGFQVSESACHTGRSTGSLMWAGLANCYYWIDPRKQLGGLLLSQVFPFVDRQILPLYYDFETAVYNKR